MQDVDTSNEDLMDEFNCFSGALTVINNQRATKFSKPEYCRGAYSPNVDRYLLNACVFTALLSSYRSSNYGDPSVFKLVSCLICFRILYSWRAFRISELECHKKLERQNAMNI